MPFPSSVPPPHRPRETEDIAEYKFQLYSARAAQAPRPQNFPPGLRVRGLKHEVKVPAKDVPPQVPFPLMAEFLNRAYTISRG